jgi:hypothetical protein
LPCLLGGSGGATVGLAFVVAHSGAFSSPSVYMTTLSIMLVDRWHVELRLCDPMEALVRNHGCDLQRTSAGGDSRRKPDSSNRRVQDVGGEIDRVLNRHPS